MRLKLASESQLPLGIGEGPLRLDLLTAEPKPRLGDGVRLRIAYPSPRGAPRLQPLEDLDQLLLGLKVDADLTDAATADDVDPGLETRGELRH